MGADTKVAVITGASQGIGDGLVRGYVERGWRVVANSRSIEKSGAAEVLAVAGDIAQPAVAERVIAEAVRAFGRVDTLVNNAGIFIAKRFTEYTSEDYARVLAVNLNGFFHVSQHAIRQMVKQGGGGHVVNITTSLVDQPVKGVPAALASLTKGGLDAVVRSLAIEYSDQGIRVNAVAPGIVKTPMHGVETHGALAGMSPAGRLGEVQEIVDAVLFLEGAKFVSGESLRVDGGAHAGRW